LTGALLVDKPAGITSHDAVARVRLARGGKAGHAGTLDPFATGLLIVLVGRATRLQRYLLPLAKSYRATARLGWRSSTGDPDGELTETGRVPARLALPTGEVAQRLPMTSAVKVGGERLYRKAHRGETVETPTRTVTVYRAELVGRDEDRAEFEIECSSGTYVRTLIETLEDAYCDRLRRTGIGPHRVVDGADVEISVERLMEFLPERVLNADEAERVGHGRTVPAIEVPAPAPAAGGPSPAVPEDGEPGPANSLSPVRLTHEGSLIAIARRQDDELRPEVVLR